MAQFQLDPGILREYDIRGIVGKTLTEEGVTLLARAFGTRIRQEGGTSVSVGFDGRLSSPAFEQAAVNGLVSTGLIVYRIGRGPTPMLYYSTYALETDGGLMITGSHNPPDYNGIKMMLKGASFYGKDIQNLGEIVAKGSFVEGHGKAVAKSMFDHYVHRILRDFKPGKDLKVAWDAGNGVAGAAMAAVCEELPGTHFLLNEVIDGTFPNHHPDPTVEKNLVQLRETVAREKCDLGIAFDGDGDRIGIVDGQGRILWGDQILVVLAGELLKRLPGSPIIADVKASQVFFDEINRMGGKAVMWCTGHSLVKAKMKEIKAPLAGEMSGHIFYGDGYYGFDDALYTALRLVSILANEERSIDQIRDSLPNLINTPELRFDCDDVRKFEVVREVKERLKAVAGINVIDVDGVRVQTADGWWLLRASNTQPVLVARCESATADGLARLKASLVEQLKACDVTPPNF